MGIRSIERQIAKSRMAAMGVGNVNKKVSGRKDDVPNWKRVLSGDMAKQGLAAQLGHGVRSKRKIRRVSK